MYFAQHASVLKPLQRLVFSHHLVKDKESIDWISLKEKSCFHTFLSAVFHLQLYFFG